MRKVSAIVALLLPLVPPAASAFQAVSDLRQSCKSNGARALLPVLQSGIKFKPEFEKLKAELEKLDAPRFCDCVYDEMERQFGSEKTLAMAQLTYSAPAVQFQQESQSKERIYFACFGRQIGRADLSPPSPDDVRRALARSNPEPDRILVRKAQASLSRIQNYIELRRRESRSLPERLSELVIPPTSLSPAELKDPWGNEIVYKRSGDRFELISPGPDGKPGTADDIRITERGSP